jgi:hypothetical protein
LYGGTRLTSAPFEQHLARRRLLEAGDHLQRRGLAAPRRAEHREELALLDGEVGVFDRDEVPERLADVVESNDGVAHLFSSPRRRVPRRQLFMCRAH